MKSILKKNNKIIWIITLLMFLLLGIKNICYAETVDGALSRGDSFLDLGTQGEDKLKTDKDVSKLVYNVLLSIGIAVAFIWGIILGIQFTTGSIDEKAEVKKNIIVYLIGCVIIFGAFGIWKIVVDIMSKF